MSSTSAESSFACVCKSVVKALFDDVRAASVVVGVGAVVGEVSTCQLLRGGLSQNFICAVFNRTDTVVRDDTAAQQPKIDSPSHYSDR